MQEQKSKSFLRRIALDSSKVLPFTLPPVNKISDPRYNWLKVIPYNLFEQFHRVSNIWFLIISIFELLPYQINPTTYWSTVLPLSFLIFISLVQDLYNCYNFNKKIKKVNDRSYQIWNGQDFTSVKSKFLAEGMIIQLDNNQTVPADIVLLARKNSSDSVFLDITNLIGSFNLLEKKALDAVERTMKSECEYKDLDALQGEIRVSEPSPSYSDFSGTLRLENQPKALTLRINHLLVTGGIIKGSESVIGIIVYCGNDSKLALNLQKHRYKLSKVEKKVNLLALFILALVLLFVVMSIIGYYANGISGDSFTQIFILFTLLYSNMIPISMFVVIDIIRVIQSFLYKHRHHGVLFTNEKLNENLGQVEFLVTDKSKTFSEAEKHVSYCIVNNKKFEDSDRNPASSLSTEQNLNYENSQDYEKLEQILTEEYNDEVYHQFIRHMCLCNNLVQSNKDFFGLPEEMALLDTSKKLGYMADFSDKKITNLYYKNSFRPYKKILTTSQELIKNRTSVIIEDYTDGCGYIYTKSNSKAILSVLSVSEEEKFLVLDQFSEIEDMNTVPWIFAYKEISQDKLLKIKKKIKKNKKSLLNLNGKIEQIFREEERDLKYLGVAGITEKLQPGAVDTFNFLKKAGIKVWLTSSDSSVNTIPVAREIGLIDGLPTVTLKNMRNEGGFLTFVDKAINQYIFCKFDIPVLNPSGSNFQSRPIRMSENFEFDEEEYKYREQLSQKFDFKPLSNLNFNVEDTLNNKFDPNILPYCVIIDQKTFSFALTSEKCKKMLTCLLVCAKAVCFVELMPADKAAVVKLLKENLASPPCVAAIGSDDSDFAMVKSADISIGVQKRRDFLVFNYTDVIVFNFSQLSELLVFEGHYSYHRISKVILLFLYKNWMLTIIQLFFNMYTNCSGNTAYSASLLLGFNIFLTTIPVVYIGIFDEDVTRKHLKKKPEVYATGISNDLFNFKRLFFYFIVSVLQSVIIVLVIYQVLPIVPFKNGFTENMDMTGTIVYMTLVLSVNRQFFLESFTYSASFLMTLGFSLLALLVFILILTRTDFPDSDLTGVDRMLPESAFALCSILITSIIISIPSLAAQFFISIELKNSSLYSSNSILGSSQRLYTSKGGLGTLYKSSESNISRTISSEIYLNSFSLKLQPEYINKKYSFKFIKTFLKEYKVKVLLLFIASIFWIILLSALENSNVSYLLLQTATSIVCLIFLFLLYSHKIRYHYQQVILIICLSIILFKLVLDISFPNSQIMYNILFTGVTFLEFNVHWLGVCFLDFIVLVQSLIAVCLTSSASQSSSYIINSVHELILLTSITICAGVQAYFTEASRREEFILLKTIKTAFYRSSSILKMLLPAFVKHRVKRGCRYIAENQGEVTVIFCDICDFDKICAHYTPLELTIFLDKLFSLFDKFCENTGVAKIETVGKTYMACAGLADFDRDLPVGIRKESHGKRALEFAMAVLEEVAEIQLLNGESLGVKIGINSGPVTAGVVGYHKPQFSLVGDTVNTASRMCSTLTEENSIQISESTYQIVKYLPEYEFTPGTVEAKGKGKMSVYLVYESSKNTFKEGSENSLKVSSHLLSDSLSPSPLITGFSSSREHSYHSLQKQSSWKNVLEDCAEEEHISELPRMASNFKNASLREEEFFEKRREKNFKLGLISLIVACITYGVLFVITLLEAYVSETANSVTVIVLRGVAWGYLMLICTIYKLTLKFVVIRRLIIPCIVLMYATALSFLFTKTDIPAGIICAEIVFTGLVQCHSIIVPYFLFGCTVISMALVWMVLAGLYSSISSHIFFLFIFLVFNLFYTRSIFIQERMERKNFNLKFVANKEIKENKALLKKLMPKHVLKSLGNEQTQTDRLQNVTLLYADIVGFTNWSASKTPNDIVQMLSELFTSFDKLCVELNVYKVYTIGDCYVVMGLKNKGDRDPEEECVSVVKMAFSMIEVIKEKNETHGSSLDMRIGVHSGEVVGAVIGTSIVRYDIWGSDVLITNKMESNGRPGMVKVSEDTMKVLRNAVEDGIEFEEGEDVEIKSLGIVKKTFWVKCGEEVRMRQKVDGV